MPKIKYQDFNFRPATLDIIEKANTIIIAYQRQGFILTLRQLYYQFVSRGFIANNQNSYNKLGGIINDARLAGFIDWNALEDRTRNVRSIGHWDSPDQIIEAVSRQYAIDKWERQKVRPEVWIEKDALVGVIELVCNQLDIAYFSCRGYTSQSEMWGAAMRFVKYAQNGQAAHIIHLGDHDPSGQDMSRDIEDRIRMFMTKHLGTKAASMFDFTRIALNTDQVQQYNPPPNPAKVTDSRFLQYQQQYGDESWELDALDPAVIADLIRSKVMELRDEDLWGDAESEESEQRGMLAQVSNRWDDVVDFIRQ